MDLVVFAVVVVVVLSLFLMGYTEFDLELFVSIVQTLVDLIFLFFYSH